MPSTIETDLEGLTQTQETEAEKLDRLREEKEKPLRERINRMQEDVRSFLLRAGYFHERIEELSQSISSPADKAKFLDLQEGLMSRMFETVEVLKNDLQQLGIDPEQLTEIKRSEAALKRYGYSEKAAFKSRLDIATQAEKERQVKNIAFRDALEGRAATSEAPNLEANSAAPAPTEPAPIQSETAASTENRESFERLQKHVIDNWDKQIDNEVVDQLRKVAPALSEAEVVSTGMANSLPPEVFAIIQQARQLADQAESATSETDLDAVQAQRNAIMKQFAEATETPETAALIRSIAEQQINNKFKEHLISTWDERLDKDVFDIMSKVSKKFAEETLTKDLPAASRDLIQQAQLLSKEIGAAPNEEAVNEILRKRNNLLEQLASSLQLPANPQMWFELTNKAALEVVQRFFTEVSDDNFASFINYTLDEDVYDIISEMHKIGASIDYTKPEAIESALKQRQSLIEELVHRLKQPDHGLRPESEKTEKETYAPVSMTEVRADIYKRDSERLKQKAETYFSKFDQLYGEFQQVAMRADPEARKNIDEIFVDFIAYENTDPEAIPAPLKQALLDAALEVYKTANNHEFSHEKFYSLSKDERESTGANTLNQIAGHLNLRGYLIEKTSLPPAKPTNKPKPRVKVTPKQVQTAAAPQQPPQPSAETQSAAVPTPEVKPTEVTTTEQPETPINPELLKVLDSLRETTGLTTLDQPGMKRLYQLFENSGDPKTWHQAIKDDILALTEEILFDAGIDPKPKVVWNEKIARLKTLDISSALYRNKGIDQQDLEYLQQHQDMLQRKLLPDDTAALSTMNRLRQVMGMPEKQSTQKVSPADIEAMLAALARKVKREPKKESSEVKPFSQRLAEKITQHEQKEPQDGKAKALTILDQLNNGKLNGQQARARLMAIKDIEVVAKELVGDKAIPSAEAAELEKYPFPKQEGEDRTVSGPLKFTDQLLAYNHEQQKSKPDLITDSPDFNSAVLNDVDPAGQPRVKELFRMYQDGLISTTVLRNSLDRSSSIKGPKMALMKKYEAFVKAKRAGLQTAGAEK